MSDNYANMTGGYKNGAYVSNDNVKYNIDKFNSVTSANYISEDNNSTILSYYYPAFETKKDEYVSKMQDDLSNVGNDTNIITMTTNTFVNASYCDHSDDVNKCLEYYGIDKSDSNISIYTGFSNGHNAAVVALGNDIKNATENGGTYNVPSVLINYDGDIEEKCSRNSYKIIGEQHIPAVYYGKNVSFYDDNGSKKYTQKLLEAGSSVYNIHPTSASHDEGYGGFAQDSFRNGLLSVTASNCEIPENLTIKDKIERYYMDGDTIEHQEITLEQYQKLVKYEAHAAANGLEPLKKIDFDKLNNGEYDVDFLKSLNTTNYSLSKLDLSSVSSGTLASDYLLVFNSMDSICKSISNNSAFNSNQSLSLEYEYDKTTSIPAGLLEAQKGIIGISSSVCSKLNQEVSLIMNAANVIYDMNQERAAAAANLSDGSNLLSINEINNVLSDVINANIECVFSTSNFMFNPGSHIEGNTGALVLNDLKSMYSSGGLTGILKENFDSEINDAKNTITEINNFQGYIKNGNNLKGEMWNEISSKLNVYNDLMNLRIESMEKLEVAYENALKLLIDYIGNYDEINDAELPELKQEIVKLKSEIEQATIKKNKTHKEPRTTKYGKSSYIYYISVFDFPASVREQAARDIEIWNNQVKEIEAYIAKIEGLPDIISKSEQIVNDTLSEIYGSYGTKANDTVVGNSSSYIPPINTNYQSGINNYNNNYNYNDNCNNNYNGNALNVDLNQEVNNNIVSQSSDNQQNYYGESGAGNYSQNNQNNQNNNVITIKDVDEELIEFLEQNPTLDEIESFKERHIDDIYSSSLIDEYLRKIDFL